MILLALLIGIIQSALYWLVAMVTTPDGSWAPPQPDTLLYCQAARRVAEGHPFVFSAGSLPSTGNTTVLYPFLLALPYLMGFAGDALMAAAHVLNSVFFLVFLASWTAVFCRWIEKPQAQVVGVLVLAIFGQTAYAAFAQSDIGFWLAISGLLAYSLAESERRPVLLFAMLVVGPWVRPEGAVCVVAYMLIVPFVRESRLRNILFGLGACLSVAGVFAFNIYLTGDAQFSSVAHKGYFKACSFASAIHSTAADAIKIAKVLAFGEPSAMPRDLLFLPFWSAVMLWIGVVVHKWDKNNTWRLCVWLLAALGGVATVAQSGWQNTNLDRYLAWVMPMLVMFIAEGACWLSERINKPWVRFLPVVAIVLFTMSSSITYAAIYSCNFREGGVNKEFAKQCNQMMGEGSSWGGWGWSGMAYYFGGRKYCHLSGIYSQEYEYMSVEERLEELKREAAKRFDYWMFCGELSRIRMGQNSETYLGPTVLVGHEGIELRKADWSAFDAALSVDGAFLQSNLVLKALVDVGYRKDESRYGYEVIDRLGRGPFDVVTFADQLNGTPIVEGGRLVIGGDSVSVPLERNRDVCVVMRTYPRASSAYYDGAFRYAAEGDMVTPLNMNIQVDRAQPFTVTLPIETNGFTDVAFVIPGGYIQNENTNIAFLGDHISCGYWFYQ